METCGKCGQAVSADDAFCGSCGERRSGSAPGMPSAGAATATTSATVVRAMPDAVSEVQVPEIQVPEVPVTAWPSVSSDGSWPGGGGIPGGGGLPADAAVGRGRGGAQVGYEGAPDQSFDPLSNRPLRKQFLGHAVIYMAAYGVGAGLSFVALLIVALVFPYILVLYPFLAGVFGVLFLCLYWLIPVPAQLSEWKCLVDDQAAAAPIVFEHISWAVVRHQLPLDLMQVRRLQLAGGQARDYLELRRDLFTGFVCAFPYGQDLYVGWTFWLRVSPARVLLMTFARLWQTLFRRGTDLYVTLRYDYAKAMREAIHSVAREGTDVAVGQLRAQGQGTLSQTFVAVTDFGN